MRRLHVRACTGLLTLYRASTGAQSPCRGMRTPCTTSTSTLCTRRYSSAMKTATSARNVPTTAAPAHTSTANSQSDQPAAVSTAAAAKRENKGKVSHSSPAKRRGREAKRKSPQPKTSRSGIRRRLADEAGVTAEDILLAQLEGVAQRGETAHPTTGISPHNTESVASMPMETAGTHATVSTEQLSTRDLRSYLSAVTTVDKLLELATHCKEKLSSWSRLPFHGAMRELEKQLSLAIEKGTFEAYASLYDTVRQRYEDPISSSQHSSPFLSLYTLVLVNYGAFCLVNFECQRAAHLFEESLRVSAQMGAAEDPHGPMSTHQLGMLFVRILLGNALAAEQHYWSAAEQYQSVVATMQRFPCTERRQVVPGRSFSIPFSEEFVQEEVKLFFSDRERVQQAISQGRAQLLFLQSRGAAKEEQLRAKLALARLYVGAEQFESAQKMYEDYLDQLVDFDMEDSEHIMLEFGRVVAYKMHQPEVAVLYLQTSATALCEDAEAILSEVPQPAMGEARSPIVTRAAVRAAGALVDLALTLHDLDRTANALGPLEAACALLDCAGVGCISGWVHMKLADLLASVNLVDKALAHYRTAMEMLRAQSEDDTTPFNQLTTEQRLAPFVAEDVEVHLAHCYQVHVGDHRRAKHHYQNALQGIFGRNATDLKHGLHSHANNNSTSTSASTSSSNSVMSVLSPDTVHWALTSYVRCCERLKDWEAAVEGQYQLIELEAAVGANLVPSYVKLINLMRHTDEKVKQLALYFYLFFLPEDMLDNETRHRIAHGFALCCYQLGNQRMGTVLLRAVLEVRGDHDPAALSTFAAFLVNLDPTEQLRLDGIANLQVSMTAIASVFRRAASLIVTRRVVDEADRASRKAAGLPDAPMPTAKDYLSSVVALSRGAFFFQQNGFTADAEELYKAAYEIGMSATGENSSEFNLEFAIVLVNYAALKSADELGTIERLYEQAAALVPGFTDVHEVVTDFFLKVGNYTKAAKYAAPLLLAEDAESTATLHTRLARIGVSEPWDHMEVAEKRAVLEHLLRALRPTAAPHDWTTMSIPTAPTTTGATPGPPPVECTTDAALLRSIEKSLLEGVALTMSSECASLACYTVQTRFDNPKLLNDMYRIALRRFPSEPSLTVNYAKLCLDCGYHTLARKYYARAFGTSDADIPRTQCYANFLCGSFDDQQNATAEVVYRYFVERDGQNAQSHGMYANFLACVMPSPFKAEHHFEQALKLEPTSEQTCKMYAHFVWAAAASRTAYVDKEVNTRIFDKAEQLFRRAVALSPNSAANHLSLGTFYAARKNHFEEAVPALRRAYELNPRSFEAVRELCGVLVEECTRLQREEAKRDLGASKQGVPTRFSPHLRAMIESTQECFERALQLNANHRPTLELYAQFAIAFLKDHHLAANLMMRIQRLAPSDDDAGD